MVTSLGRNRVISGVRGKEMRITAMWLPLCLALASCLLSSCGNPLDILGPRDKPKIVSDQWDTLQVSYWVYTADPDAEVSRTFTITNQTEVIRLKSLMQVEEISGLSIGTGDQLIFKRGQKGIWHGNFCFEDALYVSMTEDACRSYKFVLSGVGFYDELRRLCALNERRFHPEATPEYIKLRSNLAVDYPRLKTRDYPEQSPAGDILKVAPEE